MSLDFKLHYDRLREGDPTKPEPLGITNDDNSFYEGPSHVRSLCLAWPDGRREFLNYAFLIGGTFTPSDQINEITLDFSVYKVNIRGYSLEQLFIALLGHLPKQVVECDKRYMQSVSKDVFVTEITIIRSNT